MRRIFVVVLLFASFSLSAQQVYTSSGRPVSAKNKNQKREKGFNPDNLIFGGGLGAVFGQVTNVSISPILGYRFNDRLSAGVSLGYTYFRIKDYFQVQNPNTFEWENKNFVAHSFSTGIWGRVVVFDNVFLHAEPEYFMFRYKDYTFFGYPVKRAQDVPTMLIGGGYRFPVSDRASMVGMLLYDIIQDKYSPYGNTVFFRMGFNVGF